MSLATLRADSGFRRDAWWPKPSSWKGKRIRAMSMAKAAERRCAGRHFTGLESETFGLESRDRVGGI